MATNPSSSRHGKEVAPSEVPRRKRVREGRRPRSPLLLDPIPEKFHEFHCLTGKRLVHSHIRETDLYELFAYQGWIPFMEFKHDIWSVEVILFYMNLSTINGNVRSTVHSNEIRLTPDMIAEFFSIENDHLSVWSSGWPDNESIRECTWVLTADSPDGQREMLSMPKKSSLGPRTHILFQFINKHVLPRDRQDGIIDNMVGYVMWKVLTRVKLNLPFYILTHMDAMKVRQKVPYGPHLSYIFSRLNIPHHTDHVQTHTRSWNLSLSSLKQSGIYLYGDRFISEYEFKRLPSEVREQIRKEISFQNDIRKDGGTHEDEMEAAQQDPSSAVPGSAPLRSSATQDILDTIQASFQSFQDTMMDRVEERFLAHHTSMTAGFHQMEQRFDLVNQRLDRMDQRFESFSADVQRDITELSTRLDSWDYGYDGGDGDDGTS